MSQVRLGRGAVCGALAAIAAVIVVLAPVAPAAAKRAARPRASAGRVWLTHDVLALGYATKLGPSSPSQVMTIGISRFGVSKAAFTAVTCRGIPDVADESGDIATSSYDIYSDELGGASSEGGTSLSSPLMVGMWARMQVASRHGTGFADPDIYRVAENATAYARDFNDYPAGTNGFYQATPGWDYVSGWGTPVLSALMSDIDGRTTPVR